MKIKAIFNSQLKHVKIHGYNLPTDSYGQILTAQKGLENYARHKKVNIDIYNGDHILSDLVTGKEEEKVSNKLFVTVTDLHNNKQQQSLIPAETSKNYLYNRTDYRVYETQDETQFVRKFIAESHEDSFIRNFYRKIESMVKDLRGINK